MPTQGRLSMCVFRDPLRTELTAVEHDERSQCDCFILKGPSCGWRTSRRLAEHRRWVKAKALNSGRRSRSQHDFGRVRTSFCVQPAQADRS
jgi:hypothetical protein